MRRPQPVLWRRDHVVAPLYALAYFERATAHVIYGHLPKIESLDIKLALGQHQYQSMQVAARLERAFAMMQRHTGVDGAACMLPRRFRDDMIAIDDSADVRELLRRLYLGVKPALAREYRRSIAKADATLDATLLETLVPALAELEAQIAWARTIVGRGIPYAIDLGGGDRIARADWLWQPRARVPLCVRPNDLAFKIRGELAPNLDDAPGTRGAAGHFFHHLTTSEISTMELFGRCSYEHPDMPEAFHQDYARITWDEARHAVIAMQMAAQLGRPLGTYTIDTDLYDFMYQFPACAPGSKQELLWRLLLQGTFRESLIIEGFTIQAKKMRYSSSLACRGPTGLAEAARAAEVMADEELFHVEAALRWSRRLCGDDVARTRAERERAHAYYVDEMTDARKQYVQDEPDLAIAETESYRAYGERAHAFFPFSLTVHINRSARRAIGFAEPEIDQLVRWGYLAP